MARICDWDNCGEPADEFHWQIFTGNHQDEIQLKADGNADLCAHHRAEFEALLYANEEEFYDRVDPDFKEVDGE